MKGHSINDKKPSISLFEMDDVLKGWILSPIAPTHLSEKKL